MAWCAAPREIAAVRAGLRRRISSSSPPASARPVRPGRSAPRRPPRPRRVGRAPISWSSAAPITAAPIPPRRRPPYQAELSAPETAFLINRLRAPSRQCLRCARHAGDKPRSHEHAGQNLRDHFLGRGRRGGARARRFRRARVPRSKPPQPRNRTGRRPSPRICAGASASLLSWSIRQTSRPPWLPKPSPPISFSCTVMRHPPALARWCRGFHIPAIKAIRRGGGRPTLQMCPPRRCRRDVPVRCQGAGKRARPRRSWRRVRLAIA